MLESWGTLSLGTCSVSEAGENSLTLTLQHLAAAMATVTHKLLGRATENWRGTWEELCLLSGSRISLSSVVGAGRAESRVALPEPRNTSASGIWMVSMYQRLRKAVKARITPRVQCSRPCSGSKGPKQTLVLPLLSLFVENHLPLTLLQTVCDTNHESPRTENQSQT